MTKLSEVVNAYVACGDAIGFLKAEMLLMKYLPKNKLDGKCYDIPAKKRAACLIDLKNAAKHGMQLTDGRLRVLNGDSQPATIIDDQG